MSKPIRFSETSAKVMAFEPPVFELGIPQVALDTAERQQQGSRFRLSELTRQQTGLHDLERAQFEELVETRAAERLKEIQEAAYREAFDLGMVEGRKEAFQQNEVIIKEKLAHLDMLMVSFERIKTEMMEYNEAHLVQLAFHIAKRLASHEISVTPEATLNILRQAVEVAQSEEELTVMVAPDQLAFLEELKTQTGRELEFMKKLKFEPDPSVGHGGCVIRNNYGEIDSRFEERVGKLWDALKESLINVKPELKTA
ncbi:MAG: flagellar assembly protein [Bdellovibrionaceae bacterium]|nr:flagellar assembly protein [Pseudobdellovibrionaceae bacterium]